MTRMSRVLLAAAVLLLPGCGWLGHDAGRSPVRPHDAVFIPSSSQVVYASKSGVVADGTTDNTTTVQAVLDRFGAAGTPLEFCFDQPGTVVFAGTVGVWSNQTISGVSGAKLKKAGSATSNTDALLRNKHPVAYSTGSITDQHITIRNLYVDGNRRGGANGMSGGGSTPNINSSNVVVTTLVLAGVQDFRVENVYVYDPPSFGLQLSNAVNGTVFGFSTFAAPGDTYAGNAVVQCQGGTSGVHMYSLFGQVNDDPVAFNSNDDNDRSPPPITYSTGTVHAGPISHCSVTNAYFVAAAGGGHFTRLLSSDPTNAPIDDITLRGITATVTDLGLAINGADITGSGSGSYDRIRVIDCVAYLAGSSPFLSMDAADCGEISIEHLTLIPTSSFTGTSAMYTGSGTIETLEISGLRLRDPNGYLAAPILAVPNTVNHLVANGWKVDRGALSTLTQAAINISGTVGRCNVAGGLYDRLSNVVLVSGGTTSVVTANGVSHTNAGGGKSFTTGGGTLSSLVQAGNDSANVGP